MVQILEGNSRGSQLGRALGAGIEKGASQASKFAQEMQMEKFKRKSLAQGMEAENKVLKDKHGIDLTGITEGSTRKSLISEELKRKRESAEKEEVAKGITNSLDWLDENIKYSGKFGVSEKFGGIEDQHKGGALGIKSPSGENLSDLEIKEIRQGIDTTGLWATDKVYTHFNKGVINKEKWDSVKNDLSPRADLPPKINRARMASLRRIMGLPPNAAPSVVDKTINAEVKAQKKIENSVKKTTGKPLTDAVVDYYLKQSGNDFKKAEELAKEHGYTW